VERGCCTALDKRRQRRAIREERKIRADDEIGIKAGMCHAD
jgi:hypothetical protein